MSDKHRVISRRKAIGKIAGTCLFGAIMPACHQELKRHSSWHRVCALSELAEGWNPFSLLRLLICRQDQREGQIELWALSLVCTHQTCLLKPVQMDHSFLCPCHGSRFDSSGNCLNGPAELPLPWYELQHRDGDIYADLAKTVAQGTKLSIGLDL